MTDDLNERCAMAMGWTFITFPLGHMPDVKHWKRPDTHETHWRPTPRFASDPATIPEMHAFLSSHAFKGGWHTYSLVWQGATAGGWQACFCRAAWLNDLIEWGETLNLALARLVCAVAEARKK